MEDLVYETRPDPLSHPGRLAVSALLSGLEPAPLTRCRVLEFGCGDGAHLLPIAVRHAGVTAVGVEMSAVAAGRAIEAAEALGVSARLSIETKDLCDFHVEGRAPFDYVTAHGLYSWVAPRVRARLLEQMCATLSPHGVGYLSFNARPGWAVRGELRELLLRWAGDGGPRARVDGARRGIAVLRAALADASTPGSRLLAEEVERANEASDAYLLAEHLAAHNRAFDLSEVAQSAADAGLVVIGELARATADGIRELTLVREISAHVSDPDVVRRTADLLLSRQLRRMAVARADAPRQAARLGAVLPLLHLNAPLRRIVDSRAGSARFATNSEAEVTVREPEMVRALERLAQKPRETVAVATLLEAADDARGRDSLVGALAVLVAAGHGRAWVCALEAADTGECTALARHEQQTHGWVSSLLHEAVELEAPLARALADVSAASPQERQTLASLGLLG